MNCASPKTRTAFAAALCLSSFLFAAGTPRPLRVVAAGDHVDCRYRAGETAQVTFTVCETNGAPATVGAVRVCVDNFGSREMQPPQTFDLARTNRFVVSATRATPGFLRFRVCAASKDVAAVTGDPKYGLNGPAYLFGVAFDADKIVSGTPDVADFDAFWSNAVARLDAAVPPDVRLEPNAEASKGACNVFRISVATWGGRRTWGWLLEPKDASRGPYPVHVGVAGAGIGFPGPGGGDPNRIVLNLNVHSYPQHEGKGPAADAERKRLYDAQDAKYAKPCGVARYCLAGIHLSREDYFYYASILGLNRLVDVAAARPLADARRVSYGGTSQGGGMGLALAYLNRHVARAAIFVPAITDLLGFQAEEGRMSGWPRLVEGQLPTNRAAAIRNAPYFCGVNFARRIAKPIRFVAGFSDDVCPPAGVLSAFNACPSKDKDVYWGVGMGHRVFGDFYDLLGAWERDFAQPAADGKGVYRVLAFNIWGDFFGNPVHERDVGEAAIVRKWNPDFVCLQEATPNFWTSRLFPLLTNDYAVVGDMLGSKPQYANANNPVLYRRSRFDLVEKGARWFCPELDGSKGVTWAVLREKATGRAFVVFASHFWWRYDGQGDDWIRLMNAQVLHDKVFALAKKYDAAIVGGGDLNSPMSHAAMQYLVSHGLADAQRTAAVSPRNFPSEHGDPVRGADRVYRGKPAVRGMCAVPEKYLWLDHVFYDPARLVADRFMLDCSPAACAVSDHHPIIADFRLR